jgi:hypothetical protein
VKEHKRMADNLSASECVFAYLMALHQLTTPSAVASSLSDPTMSISHVHGGSISTGSSNVSAPSMKQTVNRITNLALQFIRVFCREHSEGQSMILLFFFFFIGMLNLLSFSSNSMSYFQ